MNPDRSQQQAEQLADYLQAMDDGTLWHTREPFDAELLPLLKLGRQFKVVNQPRQPRSHLITAWDETKPSKRGWLWLIPLPVMGVLAAATMLFWRPQQPTANQPLILAQSTQQDITAQLQTIDQLTAEFATSTDQFDQSVESFDALVATDSLEAQ